MGEGYHIVIGCLLLAVIAVDFAWTIVGAVAKPFLSNWLARGTFATLHAVARVTRLVLLTRVSGIVVMSAVAAFWIGGFWLAWTLIYFGAEASIKLTSETAQFPTGWDYAAHTGHLLSTLGGATTQPADTMWNLIGALVGVNGMLAFTLAVSFLLSTTQTVSGARAFARRVALEDDQLDPSDFEAQLAELASAMGSAPFALYYSHPDPDSRFPNAVLRLLDQADRMQKLSRMRRLLADLPMAAVSADASDAEYLEAMRDWADRLSFPPPRDRRG